MRLVDVLPTGALDVGSTRSAGISGLAPKKRGRTTIFATLEKELIHRRSWSSRRELSTAVFEYIEAFYDRDRRLSTLGMHSSGDYEMLPYAAKDQDDRTTKKIKSIGHLTPL
jgi:transposase InsO family protein